MDGFPAPALSPPPPLPPVFEAWFEGRGWRPRSHQLAMVEAARAGRDVLLIAPTGGGKTLAGFLPSLIELAAREPSAEPRGVHTLYLSPLKALATDVGRNLEAPVADMRLAVTVESRTGDTPQARRQRQREQPPDILLTTPEQLALFCAWDGARDYFRDLRCVIVDEIHAVHGSKRGDLLALGIARLSSFAPAMRRVGLSATVDDPEVLTRWLGRDLSPPVHGGSTPEEGEGGSSREPERQAGAPSTAVPAVPLPRFAGEGKGVLLIRGAPGASPVVDVLISEGKVPWAGHTAQHAMAEVYAAIQTARIALIFVNTRFQAEFAFQELWRLNEASLPIALHHGSLAAEQRRRVEAAMAAGELRAVVCTSTLDLGIDWGDVDLVIQLAAPKGASRMVQRIGRANHRLDEPSRALLVPANRFEMLECQAAREAVQAGALDGDPARTGALDALAQHVMGVACGEPFDLVALYDEVRACGPYRDLSWEDWEQVVDFVSTGGYALKTYDRFRRIVRGADGLWRARTAMLAQRHRMNVGAILSAQTLTVRVGTGRKGVPGRKIGEAEEGFFEQLGPADTFIFAGGVWKFEGIEGLDAYVTPAPRDDPKVPSWGGSKFPLSTYLAGRVRELISHPQDWDRLPRDVCEWLGEQRDRSAIPAPGEMLLETFPRGKRNYLVCYPFEGRLAHSTLAMLLTRRLERAGVGPLGYVCNDYALSIWSMRPMDGLDLNALFAEDMLGDDLEAWLDESFMMKRSFKACAVIAGLIERRMPGQEKTGRQVTFSADLIYDVLRRYQPDHLLLRCARSDAAEGLLDVARLGSMLARIRGRIRAVTLTRVSPFAVPIMMEIGRERVGGSGEDDVLAANESELIAEALGRAEPPLGPTTLEQAVEAMPPRPLPGRVRESKRDPWRGSRRRA